MHPLRPRSVTLLLMLSCWCLFQLENLVYYNRLKHSKIVISDFHLAKLENGLIKEPCGTPEYLGKYFGSGGLFKFVTEKEHNKQHAFIMVVKIHLIKPGVLFVL